MTNRPSLFLNLRDAGKQLAPSLEKFRNGKEVLVLGIVRAGVPLAVEVAKHLHLPLDVVCLRRLLSVQGTNEPMCAVMVAGVLVLDDRLATAPATREEGWEFFLQDALSVLTDRSEVCRNDAPATAIEGKTVLLVDNGVTSGYTIRAVVRALRTLLPRRIVVAVAVAALETRSALESVADETVCLAWHSPFGHVGLWYAKIDVPGIEQINVLLQDAAIDSPA